MLQIGIFWPTPVEWQQFFSAVGCSVHFALQEDTLPRAVLFYFICLGFHKACPFNPLKPRFYILSTRKSTKLMLSTKFIERAASSLLS
jgi:hypothetical protein